jgi:hypothetical protein
MRSKADPKRVRAARGLAWIGGGGQASRPRSHLLCSVCVAPLSWVVWLLGRVGVSESVG